MKRLMLFLTLAALLVMPARALAVESATATMFQAGPWTVVDIVWVSHTDGTVSYTFSDLIIAKIRGMTAYMAETDPGGTAPTTLYDIVVTSGLSTDIFGGALGDRSATVSEQVPPIIGGAYGDRPIILSLQMEITNAGNTKGGTLRIIFRPDPRWR
jgi:hypothetical protein